MVCFGLSPLTRLLISHVVVTEGLVSAAVNIQYESLLNLRARREMNDANVRRHLPKPFCSAWRSTSPSFTMCLRVFRQRSAGVRSQCRDSRCLPQSEGTEDPQQFPRVQLSTG